MTLRVEGIILAAGLSKRMGPPKLFLKINGLPVISWVIRAALASALDRVILVTGPDREEFAAALGASLDHPKLEYLMNPFPESGMSSSMIVGIESVEAGAAGAMILLADQPAITPHIIDQLLDVFRKNHDKIVVPAISGRRTTPVIFPAILFPELVKTTGDVGGREVVNRNPRRVVLIEMGSDYDDTDLDTPEDFKSMALNPGTKKGNA